MEQNIANDANNHGRDYRAMNGRIISRADQYQELMDHLDAANEERKRSIREKNTAENSVQEQRLELEAKMEGKLISDGVYRSYALDIVSPAIEYFIVQITGPLEDIRKGYRAARLFDTFFAMEEGLVTLREHVRDLSSLGFPYFNSACIKGIIDTDLERLKQEVMK